MLPPVSSARKIPSGMRARFKRRGRLNPPPNLTMAMGSKRNGLQKGSKGLQRPSRPLAHVFSISPSFFRPRLARKTDERKSRRPKIKTG